MGQRLDKAVKDALGARLESKTQVELAEQAGISIFKVNRIYRDKHAALAELSGIFASWGFEFEITVRDAGADAASPA
jgi:hypothetical protein